jgi:hypothetical protein
MQLFMGNFMLNLRLRFFKQTSSIFLKNFELNNHRTWGQAAGYYPVNIETDKSTIPALFTYSEIEKAVARYQKKSK